MPTLPLKKWSLVEFKRIFSQQLLNNLQQIYFCGTFGDPLTNTHIVDMCRFIKESNPTIKVGVHTNGGVGSTRMFENLATCTDFVAFGIDGLADTNHVYRRHVNWNKLMKNCQAFINAGGHAIWDFIVFKHNQHQVQEARELSQTLKFAEFSIKRTGRFLGRDHVYQSSLPVYNNQGFIDYTISLPTVPEYVNDNYQQIHFVTKKQSLSDYAKQTKISCNADRIKEIYIGADGFVFPCGWLHDRMYGPEVETHPDHVKLKLMMAQAGGWTQANVFYTKLEDIVDGAWFEVLKRSWSGPDRLERCGVMCGETINLIGRQNEEISYKE